MDTKKEGTFPYPNLLSSNDQTYSLLTIGEQEEQTPIEDDKTISKMEINILSLPTLDMVQKIYPDLSIENNSTYILFDNSRTVYQTKNLKDLKIFLKKNPLNKKTRIFLVFFISPALLLLRNEKPLLREIE
jgi:hypothetical protein